MLIWALPRSANADLIYAAATTCVSLLCLWVDVLGYALPLLYIALLGFALAMLSTSMLRLAFRQRPADYIALEVKQVRI